MEALVLGSPSSVGKDDLTCGSFHAPSNAEVTGIHPNEMVLFAFDDYWIPFRQSLSLVLEPPTLCEQNPVLRRAQTDSPIACLPRSTERLFDRTTNSGCGTVRSIIGRNFIRAEQTCGSLMQRARTVSSGRSPNWDCESIAGARTTISRLGSASATTRR